MPRFVLSKSKVLAQYKKLGPCADIISYSSKTNPLVGQVLEQNTDCMFSIHLENELKHIKDKKRVLFLLQATTIDQLNRLTQQEISWFVADNEQDLDEFLKFAKKQPGLNLLLRLKLRQHTIRTEKYYVFGMDSEVIVRRIEQIRLDKSLKIGRLGIHFHRNTQNMSEWNLKTEMEDVLEKIISYVDVVNIGGGIPSEYANTNADVIRSIFIRIDEFRQWLKESDVKLMLEPGRFIAAPSVRLETEILGVHENTIIVDASVYSGDMDALIVPVKLLVEGELDDKAGKPYIIKGITPCSLDLFRYRVYLKDPKKGDTLTFLNAGAYNFASDFCSLDRIEVQHKD